MISLIKKAKGAFLRTKVGKMAGAASMALLLMLGAAVPAFASEPDPGLDFGEGGFDFALADVIATAWNFLGIFPVWVQLVLGILMASTLIGFILWIFNKLPKFRSKTS